MYGHTTEAVVRNVANFAGKHLCWSLILTKLTIWRSATLLKRDSSKGVFMLNLRNSKEHFFNRTPPVAFSDTSSISKLLQLYQNQLQTFPDQILIPKKSLRLLLIAKLGQIIMTLGNYDLELTKDCSRNDCFWNILPYQRMMICTKSCSLDQNGITCINSLIPANTLTNEL